LALALANQSSSLTTGLACLPKVSVGRGSDALWAGFGGGRGVQAAQWVAAL